MLKVSISFSDIHPLALARISCQGKSPLIGQPADDDYDDDDDDDDVDDDDDDDDDNDEDNGNDDGDDEFFNI